MSPRRTSAPVARGAGIGPRIGLVMLFLIGVVAPLVVVSAPAATADDAKTLRTTITSVSPTYLTDDAKVTLSGTISNLGQQTWTEAQAYLVIRGTPLTSRTALAKAVGTDPGYAGRRVVEPGLFDEIGDLPAGATRAFSVSIPASQLPISREDGVYPVGVQILATDAKGTRSTESVSRAVTLLPRMAGQHTAAPTTVVWPFFMPTGRTATGELINAEALLSAIRPGGRLRNLLDQAVAHGADGRGVIVDPALVLAADDLANGRGAEDVTDTDQQAAGTFRDELVAIGSDPSAWVLDFDRTDVLGLAGDAARRSRLFQAVGRATDSVVQQFGLSRQRVSWPVTGGVTRTLLGSLRNRGDDPVVVNSSDLSRWGKSNGSLIDVPTPGGDLPLLVNDDITAGLPGTQSGATLRQEVLSSAAFASIDRDADAASQATAVVIVSPFSSPGPVDASVTSWAAPFSTPTDLAAVSRDSSFTGSVPRTSKAKQLPTATVEAADETYRAGDVLSSATDGSQRVEDARARSVAGVLGVRWHTQRAAGTTIARQLAARAAKDLRSITVMGPPAVTLSSSEGGFPLTITNKSPETVSVGVRLSSSNPALQLPEQDPVEIAAGERLTLTVDVDLGQQNATTVTAQLVTPDGRAFGTTSEFNVRSSRVGAVLWVTMGAAGLFVLVALARRFRRRRTDRPAMDPVIDDE